MLLVELELLGALGVFCLFFFENIPSKGMLEASGDGHGQKRKRNNDNDGGQGQSGLAARYDGDRRVIGIIWACTSHVTLTQ